MQRLLRPARAPQLPPRHDAPAGARRTCSRRHAQRQAPGLALQHLRPVTRLRVAARSAAGDWPGDEGGQPMRPQAQAQAPPQAPADVSAPPAGGGSGSGAAGASGVGAGNGARSYSEYYKSQNTSVHVPAGGDSGSSSSRARTSSSNGGGGGNGGGGAVAGHTATSTDSGGAPAAALGAAGADGAAPGGDGAAVEEAMRKVRAALSAAESTLSRVEELGEGGDSPPRRRVRALLGAARRTATACALAVSLIASHAFGLAWQWAGAAGGALLIAAWGYKRRALSSSGAFAAAAVGLITLGCSLRFGAVLLAFYFSSSKLTQFKEELKSGIDVAEKRGGQRDWRQVLCNAGVPTALACAYGGLAGCLDLPLGALPGVEAWRATALTALSGGFLGYYACCCGDTWASELGALSAQSPRLITSGRPVRRGTNGGVTLLGLSASIAGGLFVGAVFYAAAIVSPTLWVLSLQRQAAQAQWRLIPLGLMAGLAGSLLDSLLGATLQYSGYDRASGKMTSSPGPSVTTVSGRPLLSNNAVNLVSASATAALTALAALRTFGGGA